MSLVIQNNISMLNTQNKFKVNTGNKAKSTEKLSSGYRINKAADDAAGLSISEKLRWQIRGLEQGTRNGQDGVSWVQIGDGALGEVQAMLHRMKELAVQSLNDTNTPEDRAALQAEFDQLQCEIDRISETTQFNTKNIFDEHEPTYYQYEGNVRWDQGQQHVISSGANELTIEYTKDANSGPQSVTLTIPVGEYTTQELTDELEDAIKSAAPDSGLVVEFTDKGTFNINLESGEKIDDVSGDLAYLLYDTYEGGSVGALIGTTYFANDQVKLEISSQNNNLSFDIETFDGNKSSVDIVLPIGRYSRPEIIDMLNAQLTGTSVTATSYGTGIKLGSNDAIITGFKGDMFKIDTGDQVYTSVFYDNIKYGNVRMTSGTFTGGAVIPDNVNDAEHQFFKIDSTNNQLIFKANDAENPVTITLAEDEYTLAEMVSELNSQFTDAGLELKAESYDGGTYDGIKITSTIKGVTSKVGLDDTSSAYNTLFVERVYNNYKTDATSGRETKANNDATFTGSKVFAGDNVPLTITSGVNDKFAISFDGTEYTITLDAGTYNSADEVKVQLDDKLNGANALAGYKGKVEVNVTGDKIKLICNSANSVEEIKPVAVSGNTGYADIFVGQTSVINELAVSDTGSSTSPATITLNTANGEPISIDSGDNMLLIELDGVKRWVTLPTGDNVTQAEVIQAIESQVTEGERTLYYTFDDVEDTGTDVTNHFSGNSVDGTTSSQYKSYTDYGESQNQQGSAGGYTYNEAAKVTMTAAVPDTITIDNTNNQMTININGTPKTLTLANSTYTRSQLVSALQNEIDGKFTQYAGGAKVSLDSNNCLVFEARLNYDDGGQMAGAGTSISFNTSNSSLIKELHTTRKAGYVDTAAMQDTITITDANNQFSFTYEENGTEYPVTMVLDEDTYTRAEFIDMLNRKLPDTGANVKASLNGTKLRLTTNQVGLGNGVSFSSQTGGTAVDAIFGKRTTGTPATIVADQATLSSIVIDNSTNKFNITVNGEVKSVTLDNDTYTRSGFVNMLNSKLAAVNAGVTVSLNGSNLCYTTEAVGSSASVSMTYADGGSSMSAIYGKTVSDLAGVDASFDANDKLVLTSTRNNGSIYVNSENGSVFQEPETVYTNISTTSQKGYTSTIKSYVDGVDITEPITIDQWNDDLTFNYYDAGTNRDVIVDLAEKEYTFAELQNELQSQIDAELGTPGEIQVTVNGDGVRFEVQTPGSKNYILESNFKGGFYYKVMCSTEEVTANLTPKVENGMAPQDTAYAIGRKDVRNKEVEIKSGVNDTLSMEFNINGNVTELSMVLDAGTYKGASLVQMIQEKLDEQLVVNGFEAGTIEVGVGGITSGVIGANDANALNFQLSNSVTLPEEGTYIIEGVSGNAAFSVFYQTDGELIPAYVKGAKDISEGITIDSSNNTLSFDVDGTTYSLVIPEGEYTAEEIIDELNNQLTGAGAPVVAELDGNNLKFSYNKIGEHKINNISGSAKQDLFFQENGRISEDKNIKIQLSSNVGDYLEIDKPNLSTAFLKINSVAITRPKYANKALDRIDDALEIVSKIRSEFGAEQNRLEYAINSNKNKEENTQAAESRIRDVNMAEEMVEYSKHSILQQAAQAMMTQVNSNASNVLRLLQ